MQQQPNYTYIITQIFCAILLFCAIFLNIPWYLKLYIFPITSIGFMIILAILRINEIHEKTIDQYRHLIVSHANDEAWLTEELYDLTKKRNHIAFNKIHKAKYEVLNMVVQNHISKPNTTSTNIVTPVVHPQKISPTASLKDSVNQYNKELYDKVWAFFDEYIEATLTPFFTEDDITTVKHSIFEFFINDRRSIITENKVIIPAYLSMQDIAHFFHNISELMSYYKKIKQVDFFKYIPYFIVLGDYDPQSLYRNSTRTSGSSHIPLYRISDDNNIISNFVKKTKEEMPNNQRIIS